jgi:anti-anti-sigma regulatory factor
VRQRLPEEEGGSLEITAVSIGTVMVLKPKGELAGRERAGDLIAVASHLLETGNRQLLVNLVGATSTDEHALGALVVTNSRYLKAGGRLKLCSVRKAINIIKAAKLSLVIESYETEKEAVDSPWT